VLQIEKKANHSTGIKRWLEACPERCPEPAAGRPPTIFQEYIEYDIDRQLNLESYGYKFLRINKFTLLPKVRGETKTDILNALLIRCMGD
jgi:hypothetical protein